MRLQQNPPRASSSNTRTKTSITWRCLKNTAFVKTHDREIVAFLAAPCSLANPHDQTLRCFCPISHSRLICIRTSRATSAHVGHPSRSVSLGSVRTYAPKLPAPPILTHSAPQPNDSVINQPLRHDPDGVVYSTIPGFIDTYSPTTSIIEQTLQATKLFHPVRPTSWSLRVGFIYQLRPCLPAPSGYDPPPRRRSCSQPIAPPRLCT